MTEKKKKRSELANDQAKKFAHRYIGRQFPGAMSAKHRVALSEGLVAAYLGGVLDAASLPAKENEGYRFEDDQYREAARALWQRDGEIEIDDDLVSPSEEGAYVQAWVWVDNDEVQDSLGFPPIGDGEENDPKT